MLYVHNQENKQVGVSCRLGKHLSSYCERVKESRRLDDTELPGTNSTHKRLTAIFEQRADELSGNNS